MQYWRKEVAGRRCIAAVAPQYSMASTSNKMYPVVLDYEDLRFRIFAALALSGHTMIEFADFIGQDAGNVVLMFGTGRNHITVEVLINLCAYTGCTVADLLPFANSVLPQPFKPMIGGGYITEISPDPYRIVYADPEKLGDNGYEIRKDGAPESEL